MIKVNGKSFEWYSGIGVADIYRLLGYTISNPRVIVRVNGENIPKANRGDLIIPDSAEIEIINTLCGG